MVAALFGLAAPATAAHADGYRYWSYWQTSGGDWAYATAGPASTHPKDGQVEGWRFTVAAENKAAKPRTRPNFDRICAGIRIKDGYKRIGLVLDYGTAADAPAGAKPPRAKPAGTCVVVRVDATSIDVLEKAEHTRTAANGLLCAIDGYPAGGCGDAVPRKTASASTGPSGSATPGGGSGSGGDRSTVIAVAAGAVIAVALVAAMLARRRSEGS